MHADASAGEITAAEIDPVRREQEKLLHCITGILFLYNLKIRWLFIKLHSCIMSNKAKPFNLIQIFALFVPLFPSYWNKTRRKCESHVDPLEFLCMASSFHAVFFNVKLYCYQYLPIVGNTALRPLQRDPAFKKPLFKRV